MKTYTIRLTDQEHAHWQELAAVERRSMQKQMMMVMERAYQAMRKRQDALRQSRHTKKGQPA